LGTRNPQISQIDAEKRDWQTHAIIGAAMEVHRQLGPGFLEAVYQEALVIECAARDIPVAQEVELPVECNGQRLTCTYRTDLVCFGTIIVELKALSRAHQHRGSPTAQLPQGNPPGARSFVELRSPES
jgi:GxxExxY protein